VQSVVREQIGVKPDIKTSPQTCYRCNVLTKDIKELGLVKHSYEPAMCVVRLLASARSHIEKPILGRIGGQEWTLEVLQNRHGTLLQWRGRLFLL